MIRQQMDYVIGMQEGIGDEAATKFAVAFYDAIFAGTNFRVGFDLARTTIDLHRLPRRRLVRARRAGIGLVLPPAATSVRL